MFPQEAFTFEGVGFPSGVSDQPMSEEETLTGARNRASNARTAHPNADFWVGMEGGIEKKEIGTEVFAWFCILSKDGKEGLSRTGSFFLPQQIIDLIDQGYELGACDDIVFGTANSKTANGCVGLLTNDIVTRTTYYSEAVSLALIPFKNPELY